MRAFNFKPAELSLAGRHIHYAWVIVFITALMRLVSSSFRMGFPALIPLIAVEFGWEVWLVTLAFSLQWVISGAFGPAAGWLGDRYGARVTMTIGATLYIVGMILTGFMTQPWHLLLYFGIILSASMGIFQVPLTVSVTSWFRRHLGLGMGLLQGSQGLGPVVAIPIMLGIAAWFTVGSGLKLLDWGGLNSPLLSWIPLGTPEILGIRMAFWIPGIIGGIVLLLLIRAFYNAPEDIGLRQLGADSSAPVRSAPSTGATAKARASVFLRQVRTTPAFWNLIGIHYWGCAGHSIVIVFLPAMIISSLAPEGGWESITDDSARSAALLRASAIGGGAAAVMSLVSTFTRFGVPIAADLLGSKWVMAVCFFLQVAPVVILLFGILFHPVIWMFYLFAVLFGIGFGGEMSAFPIINRQYYGNAPIGTSYGFQMMGAGAGMASGALLGSLLLAVTGGYAATAALSLVMSLIGVISIIFLPGTHHHQLPDWENDLPAELRPDAGPATATAPAAGSSTAPATSGNDD